MTGLLARSIHLTCSILLVGGAAALLLAGRSDRATALRWESCVLAVCRVLVVLALLSGVVTIAVQTATLEGRAAAALEPAAITRMLTQTQGGIVWLVRIGLLVVLGAFLAVRVRLRDNADWRAMRGQSALLGLAALGLVAAASHAAAVEPGTAAAIAADVVHLVAGGIWIGGLLPLALLLWLAGRAAGADARPYAVLAARRFSRLALALVLVLVVSGIWNAWQQVGSVASLLGTRHGHLLLAKLLAFVAMLALAALNRRLVPALAGEAALGRPAMRRLSRFMAGEAALALVIVGLVTAMSVTPPGRHTQPTWPLTFRFSFDNLVAAPDFKAQVLIGSQVAVLGAVALLTSLALRRRLRLPVLAGGAVVLAGGLILAVPPLVTDAYPTTFRRPDVAYQAGSIAEGGALFATHCAVCHGAQGGGDGPGAASLQPKPPDLRAHHVALHTAGDIFWWITHGKGPMPPFGRLDADERWHLVNYLRAISAGDAAKLLGPAIEPERPWLVAPDFGFAVGPSFWHSLKDYRGRKIVLVVIYTLPASRARIEELAGIYASLSTLGVEVVAVPADAAPDAIRRLDGWPPVMFPIATDGGREIVATYRLFTPGPHAEFLVDRGGYLRAITAGAARGPDALLTEVQRLNAEKVAPPPAAEHVH